MFRTSRSLLFVCLAPALLAAGRPAVRDASVSQAQTALARLPLRFEANQGQFDPSVRYAARAGGYNLLLTQKGAVISLPEARRVSISLLHANPAPAIEPLDPLAARTDYFLGRRPQWHTGVASYSRVRYRSVYPSVDMVYYGNQNQLEYDFLLQPGADAGAIRLEFRGARSLTTTPEGDLVVETGGQRIVQKKPFIYQEEAGASSRREVAGRYVLLGRHTVGLRLDPYDRSRSLVIDPVLVYCSYVGGNGADRINAVKMGPGGRLYIAGQTDTQQIPYIDGAYNNNASGLTDIFLSILDTAPDGTFQPVYFSYLGGANLDIPLAMDVDANGLVYLTGTTTSTNFPMAGNSVQPTGAASTIDAFVVVLSPFLLDRNGQAVSGLYGGDALVYSSYLGGTLGNDSGNGIAVGPDGMIYVIGTTRSADFPVTDSAYQAVLWGPQDTFLCKIDRNAASLVYSTYLGGEDADDGRNILVGPNGLVYFASSTLSTEFPMAGFAYFLSNSGGADIIIGVMDMTKQGVDSLVYATYFGGSLNEEVRKIAFDGLGNLLVTGYTLSPDYPVTPDAFQPTYGGNGDAFVAVVNPSNFFGSFLVYSTYVGGAGGEVGYDVMSDSAGSIYLTGYTLSKNFPVTPDAAQNQPFCRHSRRIRRWRRAL